MKRLRPPRDDTQEISGLGATTDSNRLHLCINAHARRSLHTAVRLKPEEVKVEFKDGNLWISGEKEQETEDSGKTCRRIERRQGEFRRMIQLPGAGDEEKVDAKFNNGVLTINVPKSQKSLPERIPVNS